MAQLMRYKPLGSTNMMLSVVSMGGSGYGRNYGPYDEKEAVQSFQYVELKSQKSIVVLELMH